MEKPFYTPCSSCTVVESIGIFSCFAVLFMRLVGSWITQETLPARGAVYVYEVSKLLTFL